MDGNFDNIWQLFSIINSVTGMFSELEMRLIFQFKNLSEINQQIFLYKFRTKMDHNTCFKMYMYNPQPNKREN